MNNIFKDLSGNIEKEIIQVLCEHSNIKIERIVSTGQSSPQGFWYDQNNHEWIIVLKGTGAVEFHKGKTVELSEGDYINIPKNVKHRVAWTMPEKPTIWLAIYYR